MGALDALLDQVKQAITQHTSNQSTFNPGNLIDHITDLFGAHQRGAGGNVRPASQDPYGDPANQGARNVRPASQDPYGDPGDTKR